MKNIDDYEFLVITLFNASLEKMLRAIQEILHEPTGKYIIEKRPLELDWVYQNRPPSGGAHLTKALLFEPESLPDKTVKIANLQDGWMTMCNLLANKIQGQHLRAITSVDKDYPVTSFDVLNNGKSIRYVRAFREDPSWEFYERGERQFFEEPLNYKKRLVRDRLNREILFSYLAKLGWDLTDPLFWRSRVDAIYIEEQYKKRVVLE
jgi:hypothetical protein